MTHLYGYLDGADDTILRYVEGCSKWPAYEAAPRSLSLQIDSADDLFALHGIAEEGLRSTREEFVDACRQSLSSTATGLAYRFKHFSKLRRDVVRLAVELHGADWVEKAGWQLGDDRGLMIRIG